MTTPALDSVAAAAEHLAVIASDHDQRKIGAAELLGGANGRIDILVLRHRADEEEELMGRKAQLVDDREVGRDGREMFRAVRNDGDRSRIQRQHLGKFVA